MLDTLDNRFEIQIKNLKTTDHCCSWYANTLPLSDHKNSQVLYWYFQHKSALELPAVWEDNIFMGTEGRRIDVLDPIGSSEEGLKLLVCEGLLSRIAPLLNLEDFFPDHLTVTFAWPQITIEIYCPQLLFMVTRSLNGAWCLELVELGLISECPVRVLDNTDLIHRWHRDLSWEVISEETSTNLLRQWLYTMYYDR